MISKLWLAIIANCIGSIIAFFQLQGHYVWPEKTWLKSIWWIYFTSLFLAPLFFYATKLSYEHFGAFWNMRLAGFGISTIIFGLLTWSRPREARPETRAWIEHPGPQLLEYEVSYEFVKATINRGAFRFSFIRFTGYRLCRRPLQNSTT